MSPPEVAMQLGICGREALTSPGTRCATGVQINNVMYANALCCDFELKASDSNKINTGPFPHHLPFRRSQAHGQISEQLSTVIHSGESRKQRYLFQARC